MNDQPRRPDPGDIHLPEKRRRHILDGDATGGGHRYGTGNPGRSEFPANWSDAKTARIIIDIARRPSGARWQRHGRWRFEGTHEGVTVVVIVDSNGEIRTGSPRAGTGVTFNPKEGTR